MVVPEGVPPPPPPFSFELTELKKGATETR